MEFFTLASKPTGHDPAAVEAALREAWNACAATPCLKCRVPPGQYCKNRTAGTFLITRFHKPRQDAAGAPGLLAPVGIHGLSWAKGTGSHVWNGQVIQFA
jgi:hypothetical protein